MNAETLTLPEDFFALNEEASQAYYHFQPRPSDPARYDQQEDFVKSQTRGVSFLVGGNGAGCLAAETEIYDPVEKQYHRFNSINSDFHVFSLDKSGRVVIAPANRPKIYGRARL